MVTISGGMREHADVVSALKGLTDRDFRFFGVGQLAYIRPVRIEGEVRYAVCGADGTPLTVVSSATEAQDILARNAMGSGSGMVH
ncbi:MAG TPA: hypothetical protein DDX54_05150 [Rhodospirillaceae bacterium]|jgi:hypothetical protein|nr:hypothetical protein [Alphaproteobacteria bacterium]HBH26768.1 hypothetical protein [Rhodospirillaceae bacterium]